MIVIRAAEMGMCFGVRDALQIAAEVEQPDQVTVHGELVHNAVVNQALSDAGFQTLGEDERDRKIPSTPLVMITAHGVSQSERRRLHAADKQLIDTTCPLVRRAHDAATELAAEGRLVVLLGKPGHVEVQGIADDLDEIVVVATPQQVGRYDQKRIGVMSQTTMPPEVFEHAVVRLRELNPVADIRVIETICHPTRRRQQAMAELLERVDAVVVVGGTNSNNTRRLVQLCRQRSIPAVHVQTAGQLSADWLAPYERIGLTAGTSTRDEDIDAVHRKLLEIANRLETQEVIR